MESRIQKYGNYTSAAENIAYGTTGGREIVLQLIIDDGVANRGHRTNIFNPSLKFLGSATSTHTVYQTETVIDYAGAGGITKTGNHTMIKNVNCTNTVNITSSGSTTPPEPVVIPEITLKCAANDTKKNDLPVVAATP
jgi:hypothetical protein